MPRLSHEKTGAVHLTPIVSSESNQYAFLHEKGDNTILIIKRAFLSSNEIEKISR